MSLSHLQNAARTDPGDDHGHDPSDKIIVEEALQREGLLSSRYVEGYFGTATVAAYAAWQRRLGYRGADADGIPGGRSLEALGRRHGFTVHD